MLKYTLAGVGMMAGMGYVSYAAEATYPGSILYPVKVGINENVEQLAAIDQAAKAEFLAQVFAERLESLHKLVENGALEPTTALAMRDDIAHRFDEAFAAITELEEDDELAEAALARAIMQTAIDYHMQNDQTRELNVTRDLEIFSGLMTETLIERSAAVAA